MAQTVLQLPPNSSTNDVASALGISKPTLYRYRQQHEGLDAAVTQTVFNGQPATNGVRPAGPTTTNALIQQAIAGRNALLGTSPANALLSGITSGAAQPTSDLAFGAGQISNPNGNNGNVTPVRQQIQPQPVQPVNILPPLNSSRTARIIKCNGFSTRFNSRTKPIMGQSRKPT
jgi:hypothetical protein